MSAEVIEAVNAALAKGDKVLIIPVKDGVRLFRFERREIKIKKIKSKNNAATNI